MKRILLTLPILLLALTGVVTYCVWVKKATITVANTNPCKTVFVVYSQIGKDQTITSERHELNPGEEKAITQRFWGVEPNFAVFAHSNDPDVVRFVYKLPTSHPGIVYYQEDLPEEKITFQKVKADLLHLPDIEASDNLVELPFVRAEIDPNSYTATFQIRDKPFQGLYSSEGVPSPDQETAVFLERSKLLADVLQRQMSFFKRWPNPDRSFPYRLGLAINDHNGSYMPGLFVEATAPMTIRGDAMPIRPGDILVKFGGHPVFSIEDLHLTVFDWANTFDKGIDVPISFECIRDGHRVSGQTMYFFNESYWGYSDSDSSLAFQYGFGDGVTLGHSVEVATALKNGAKFIYNIFRSKDSAPKEIKPYSEEVWAGNQLKARLRQMYGKEFDAGSFLGMFCPGPGWVLRLPLARVLARAGVSRVVASLGAAATIEVVEGVIWTVADASPLQKPEDIVNDLEEVVPIIAGTSIVLGSLTRSVPR